MDISLIGDRHPELSDDELLKTFCERVWDNPAFASRVQRVVMPWEPRKMHMARCNIVGTVVETRGRQGLPRADVDQILAHQGYEVINKVRSAS